MNQLRPFFGGAIECCVPSDWRDVSDIRQVPDHQECWQGPNGQVLIVEILARETSVTDEEAAAYFFRDLAEANGITQPDEEMEFHTIPEIPLLGTDLPNTAKKFGGIGRQLVRQGRDTDIAGNPRQLTPAWVRIDLCLIRLPHVESEILVTLTSPVEAATTASVTTWDEMFVRTIQSFRVVDWNLFG